MPEVKVIKYWIGLVCNKILSFLLALPGRKSIFSPSASYVKCGKKEKIEDNFTNFDTILLYEIGVWHRYDGNNYC